MSETVKSDAQVPLVIYAAVSLAVLIMIMVVLFQTPLGHQVKVLREPTEQTETFSKDSMRPGVQP